MKGLTYATKNRRKTKTSEDPTVVVVRGGGYIARASIDYVAVKDAAHAKSELKSTAIVKTETVVQSSPGRVKGVRQAFRRHVEQVFRRLEQQKGRALEARKASLPGVPDLQKVKRRPPPADFDPTAHVQAIARLEAQGREPQAASLADYLKLLAKSS